MIVKLSTLMGQEVRASSSDYRADTTDEAAATIEPSHPGQVTTKLLLSVSIDYHNRLHYLPSFGGEVVCVFICLFGFFNQLNTCSHNLFKISQNFTLSEPWYCLHSA